MNNYVKDKINSLNIDQKVLFDEMQKDKLLQICIPTGAGKGYLMMVDLLNQIVNSKNDIFVISSHRLMLNNQHLNDIFKLLSINIGKIGYIFVGSSKYNTDKFQDNIEFNKALLKKKLSYDEIVSSTISTKEVNSLIEEHKKNKRKVVILTTYHSLDKLKNLNIGTIYNDEAHTLASETENASFKSNFEQIKYDRCFFMTATPRDCVEDTESFLMNNECIFGKRVGLTFKECVEKGYVISPVIHVARPDNFGYDLEFKSIQNMAKFIQDSYLAHSEFIKEKSIDPSKIAPKLLVKCDSVENMWKIHKELIGKISEVSICSGASKNEDSHNNHFINNEGIKTRNEYLEKLQKFEHSDRIIVLHYDTMSEGININGFTGVMFLGGRLPTTTKILQNTGRSTRLHEFDRKRFERGEIFVNDKQWIKPYCAVIIPYWDRESESTTNELSRQIKRLRDDYGFDPSFIVSLGSDLASNSGVDETLDVLNNTNKKDPKFELIEKIQHEIEVMDKEEINNIELKEISQLDDDHFVELFK